VKIQWHGKSIITLVFYGRQSVFQFPNLTVKQHAFQAFRFHIFLKNCKQLLIRGTKGSRKVTLTEEGMILRKRAEEILNLVHKTEREISLSDEVVVGDVYIGTGETDAVRLIAKTARKLYQTYPGIHYHIASGNAAFVMEQLEKGLIDFGLIFGAVDQAKYNYINHPEHWHLGYSVRYQNLKLSQLITCFLMLL